MCGALPLQQLPRSSSGASDSLLGPALLRPDGLLRPVWRCRAARGVETGVRGCSAAWRSMEMLKVQRSKPGGIKLSCTCDNPTVQQKISLSFRPVRCPRLLTSF